MRRILILLICAGLLLIPVRAEGREKLVALTFDDGPSGKYTRRLLQGMQTRGVKATFLLCGYRIAQAPELTELILTMGHEVGLHGYSHKPMEDMSIGEIRQELENTRALLPEAASLAFLRAPGGASSKNIRAAAKEQELSLLLWSVDPRDWATEDSFAIETEVLQRVQDGDVVLLHDMTDSSVDAALDIMDQLQAQGFRFVTVSELAAARGILPTPGAVYTHFPPAAP